MFGKFFNEKINWGIVLAKYVLVSCYGINVDDIWI